MNAQLKPMLDEEEYLGADADEGNIARVIAGMVFTLLITGLLVLTMSRLMDPATLPIRHVSVSGEFINLSPPSLEVRAGKVVRGGFFNVNVDTIKDVLLEEPWVSSVSVRRIWPDTLMVDIREQTAVVQWGDDGLLNPQAMIFHPDPATFPDGLPVVHGPENSYRAVLDTYLLIRDLLPEELAISELKLSERRSWELQFVSGTILRLGKTDIRNRLERFMAFFSVEEVSEPGHVQYIDMRYTNGFAIRWNPDNQSDKENVRENHGKKG